MDIGTYLDPINRVIINPLITLAFAVALIVFFVGVFQFINSEAASDSKREQGKQKIMWGLVGMFIMISAYGIIRLILGTFSITPPKYPGF
jgi:hypothetical protein